MVLIFEFVGPYVVRPTSGANESILFEGHACGVSRVVIDSPKLLVERMVFKDRVDSLTFIWLEIVVRNRGYSSMSLVVPCIRTQGREKKQ
jgi:hypothetical protein